MMATPTRQADAWKVPQLPQRQDSLYEQMQTVHEAATRLGCYDAADAIWKMWLASGKDQS